jgi:BirA family transcriptional regulator, biotin operon repressor / biotin---[acetyl-CoA-carboxylase] ligase
MLILTDAPGRTDEWTASLIGSGSVKTSFGMTASDAGAWWWSRLGKAGTAAQCTGDALPALAAWPLVVAVSEAARSQYDILVECVRDPAARSQPVVALALSGHGFHGNRGRVWQALPGNLHLSAAIPVDLPAAACAPVLPALAAVALTDALLAVCGPGLPARIKWINDVLLGEAKVGGVLASAQFLGPRITQVVVGIGVNVRATPAVAPTLFVPAVTSLAAHPAGAPAAAAPGALLAALLAALAHRLDDLADRGPAGLAAVYRARCQDVGRTVAVWAEGLADADCAERLPTPLARGRVTGLDADLSLWIDGHATPLGGGRLAYIDPV